MYKPLDLIKQGLCGTLAPILVKSVDNVAINCKLAVALQAFLKDTVQLTANVIVSLTHHPKYIGTVIAA